VILPLATLHYLPSAEECTFNQFWSPVLENSNTILIGMGNNPLYEFSIGAEDEYYKNHPKNPSARPNDGTLRPSAAEALHTAHGVGIWG
jgi:hypothetical protein